MEFQWTDELVKEFQIYYNRIPYAITGIDPIKTGIDMFKTSKEKKEYEILSSCPIGGDIYSVKRLSDGEVFTVGDKVNAGKISGFYLTNWGMSVNCSGTGLLLNEIIKDKGILFTTEDGVKITDENQTLYAVLTKAQWETREDTLKRMRERSSFSTPLNPAWKYFSTDAARQDYILMNKPVHSTNDVLAMFKDNAEKWDFYKYYAINKAKEKI